MSRLFLSLLGSAQLALDAKPVARFRSEKARALLIFLALQGEDAHTRESLCGMFWGEQSEKEARHNLSQALIYLRSALGGETLARVLDISRAAIQFKSDSDTYVDVYEFLRLLRECDTHPHRHIEACAACIPRLERACALYRGELLAQTFLNDAPAFEEWLLVQREHFQRLAITALSQLTAYYEAQGEAGYGETARYARRQVELEPWREEPYRVLMRTLAAMHQPDAAFAEYHSLTFILNQELGLEPSAETNALYKHLRNQSSGNSNQSSVSNLQSRWFLSQQSSNLPLPATPLIGRAPELAQLAEKLARAECRLLTLVGQGGIGKTRLAIQTARDHRHVFPGGAYFVDLADLDSPALIPNAIAEALQFSFRGADSTARQIIQHLQNIAQPTLLILDNFEQLLNSAPVLGSEAGGAAFVGEFLKRAPHVTLLVTSRERLNIEGEWLFEVEGLRAPTTVPTRLDAEWNAPDAVQLLIQCVARVNVDAQTWSEAEKRAAIRITQLVEGMPLAIELASAWVRTLTPIEIADEIARSLDVLSSRRRDVPKRHASIRAVFEHSWKLLTPVEQQVFARLAVFRGGMTRTAAREIADASLQTLSALVDKSLVKRAAAGRFRLHELVRQFAAEKLALSASPEHTERAVEGQYSAYYLNLVAQRAILFNASGAQTVLEELRHELDNLRHAWRAASAQQNLELLASSLDGLAAFYVACALYQEGIEQFSFAQEHLAWVNERAARALVSRLLAHSAHLETRRTQHDAAIVQAKQAIALGEEANSVEAIAIAYLYWGYAVRRQGDYPRAREILHEALTRARAANLPHIEMEARTYLGGTFWNESAYALARENWHAALGLSRAQGDLRGESFLLNNLGVLAQETGDFAAARTFFMDALRLSKAVGTDSLWGAILCNLGLLEIDLRAFDSAWARLDQAYHFLQEIQYVWAEHLTQLGFGQLAAHLGDYQGARVKLEIAAQGLEAVHAPTDQARALSLLSLVYHYVGEHERAGETVARGVALAREIQDRFTLGKALLISGHIAIDENNLDAAQRAYAEALTLYAQLGLEHLQAEARAGLAQVLFVQEERDAAREHVEWLVHHLQEHSLDGADEPMRAYLTCYRILRACSDPRADEILETAQTLLLTHAATIQAYSARQRFLESVTWNRELVHAWAQLKIAHA